MLASMAAALESRRRSALVISPAEEDHEIFGELFRCHDWVLKHASSIHLASALLNENSVSVVITERDLPVGNWKDVLDLMQGLPQPPLVIVISRLANDYLWAEALNLGAYDVLAKPLDHTEVVRVLTSAWIHQQEAPAPPRLASAGRL